jgi:signal transduction histidine kinase
LATLAVQNAVLVHDSQQLATVLERSRLASELHDGVTQNLFALALTLQEVLELPDLPASAVDILHRAQHDVAEGSQQLRRALFELTQDEEEQATGGSFEDEVRQLTHQFSERAGIGADVEVRGEGRPPTEEALQLLLRTAREGLTNVLKHASATQVTVVLRRSDHWWMLEVHDDGTGDATLLRRLTSGFRGVHFGLISLRREATLLQGRMWLSQSPRLGGVQLTMSLPVRS